MTNPVGVTSAEGKAAEEEEKKITEFKVLAVAFRSDHGMLKDHSEDWLDKGKLYRKPEWALGEDPCPVSHTMDERMRIDVMVEFGPDGAEPENGVIRGEGPAEWFSFENDAVAAPGIRIIPCLSLQKLPVAATMFIFSLKWELKFEDGRALSGGTSGIHVVYATMGTPRIESHARVLRDRRGIMRGIKKGPWAEDGVTVKRMEKALHMVLLHQMAKQDLVPLSIVWSLMRQIPAYTLRPSEKVPAPFKHPNYFNDCGGAWPVSDYLSELAECQAICRLVRGILTQIGCPGRADIVLVYALEEYDNGTTALLDGFEMGQALHGKYKVVGGKVWYPTLVDGPVEEGQLYPPSHTALDDGKNTPGFNAFEACLRYTHEETTRYFGGGAGCFESKEDVIKAFWGLVWISQQPVWGGFVFTKIEKIVCRYHAPTPPEPASPTVRV